MTARVGKLVLEGRAITLAHFLPTDQIPAILQHKVTPALRVIDVEVSTNSHNFTDKLFWVFKQGLKAQNHKKLTAAIKQSPDLSDILPKIGSSAPIETTFRGQIPLESYIETDHYILFTRFIALNPTPGREASRFECATHTELNVKHKLLWLTVKGSIKDFQWSRDFSKTWAEEILAANTE